MLDSRLTLLALLLSISASAFADEPANIWPQWRGPNRTGEVSGPEWPNSLDEAHLKQLWKVELGPSYSGPIVTEDRIFITETRDGQLEVVRAFDRETGEQLWETSWEGAMVVPFFAISNGSWIRATPAYDGVNLYVAGMRDVLVCLDASTGEEKWKIDFVKELETPLPAFGFVASPLVVGEHIYVQAGASVVKIEKATGKILWRTLEDAGGMNGSAFSSPVFETLNGRQQLIVQTREKLAGVNPEDGEVLWSEEVPAFRGMNILTPTVIGNRVFTSSYGGGSFLYEIKPTEEGFRVEQLWRNKVQGYMSSPVVIDGHLYLHLRNQRFACIDLKTGEEKWITTPFGKYWSLITQGDKILALDERGELYLIHATPEKYDELSSRKVSEINSWAHVALAGNTLFIRGLNHLTVFRWENPKSE